MKETTVLYFLIWGPFTLAKGHHQLNSRLMKLREYNVIPVMWKQEFGFVAVSLLAQSVSYGPVLHIMLKLIAIHSVTNPVWWAACVRLQSVNYVLLFI